MNFADALHSEIHKKKSPLCIGLDPHIDCIPEVFTKGKTPPQIIEDFLKEVINAASPYCACVKPNLAFFEIWGSDGWRALESVCEEAKKQKLYVIADGKRNDIGSTAERYAEAFLGAKTPYDALTITPYLGQDGIIPFIQTASQNKKGVFVLVKTSNPSSGEFQDLPVGDCLLHEEVARAVARIGTMDTGDTDFSSVGAVVGATHPDDIKILRSEMPGQIFLIPGYGAQGGSAADVKTAFYNDGRGAIVNSSRGILFPQGEKDPIENIKNAAEKARKELYTISLS